MQCNAHITDTLNSTYWYIYKFMNHFFCIISLKACKTDKLTGTTSISISKNNVQNTKYVELIKSKIIISNLYIKHANDKSHKNVSDKISNFTDSRTSFINIYNVNNFAIKECDIWVQWSLLLFPPPITLEII